MSSLSSPFGHLGLPNDVDREAPWRADYHPPVNSLHFLAHNKQRWADLNSSGRPSSDIGETTHGTPCASLHFFAHDKQRWADISSSGRPSSELSDVSENASPAAGLLGNAAHRNWEDNTIPSRPSTLGQYQCTGFAAPSADDAWAAPLPDLTVVSESRGESCSFLDGLQHKGSSLPAFSETADAEEPPQLPHTVNGFVTRASSTPGIQLRVSVPVDDDASGTRNAARQGYAGLLNMLNINASDQLASNRSEPYVEAVCTGAVEHTDAVKRLLRNAANGLRAHQEVSAAREGMGGSYFLRNDAGRMSAIFKPCDEEPLAPNNPKGWEGRAMGAPGMKPSVRVGEAAFREVAAYLLDRDGFAGVPAAVLAKVWHPVLNYKVRVTKVESLMDITQWNASQAQLSGALFDAAKVAPRATTAADDSCSSSPVPERTAKTSSGLAKRMPSGIAQALVREEMSRHHTPPSSMSRTSGDSKPPVASSALQGAVRGQSKVGSLQQYVTHMCDANDISPSRFATQNVHRVGILDVRIFNCDRHAGNLLVSKPRRDADSSLQGRLQQDMLQLIPIDHGYSLPEAMDNPYFEWLYWPQASLPFGKAELEYIAKLDVQVDIAMLRRFIPLLREECLRCLEVTTTVLQMCAAAGLTLFEIGSMMTRTESLGEQLPSDLEVMCMDAREEALSAASPAACSQQSCMLSPRSAHGSALMSGVALPAWEEEDEDSIFQLEGDVSAARVARKASEGQTSAGVNASDDGSSVRLHSPPSSSSLESPKQCEFDGGDVLRREGSLPARYLSAPFVRGFFPRKGASATMLPQSASVLPRSVSSFAGGDESGDARCKHMERRMWRHKQHARTSKRPMYPPLISGDHPDLVNYVFSGLDKDQWRVFMEAVREWCEEELANETWKQSNANTAVAGSCPMFYRT